MILGPTAVSSRSYRVLSVYLRVKIGAHYCTFSRDSGRYSCGAERDLFHRGFLAGFGPVSYGFYVSIKLETATLCSNAPAGPGLSRKVDQQILEPSRYLTYLPL